MVAAAGRGTLAILIKSDLADAFRHIPVASDDHWLLGFCCDGAYRTDIFLPFGLRTSPLIFDLCSKGLHFLLNAYPSINKLFSLILPGRRLRCWHPRGYPTICGPRILSHPKFIQRRFGLPINGVAKTALAAEI